MPLTARRLAGGVGLQPAAQTSWSRNTKELETNDASERPVPDHELVRAAQAGDRAAYGRLYERYARLVHGVLMSRVSPDWVDDLLQDVFVKAMTELRGLRDETHFGGWLASIARNRATDHYRQTREVGGAEDLMAAVSTPDTATIRADARAALVAVQSLPDAYRETLTLRLVEGMTGPEIAERTGLTRDSVRVNLHRGMKLLREALDVRAKQSGGGAEAPEQKHTGGDR